MTPAQSIIHEVALSMGLTSEDLTGSCRWARYAEGRHLAAWAIRHALGLPYTAIGAVMGGRHHTTVMHSVQKVDARLDEYERAKMIVMLREAGELRRALQLVGA